MIPYSIADRHCQPTAYDVVGMVVNYQRKCRVNRLTLPGQHYSDPGSVSAVVSVSVKRIVLASQDDDGTWTSLCVAEEVSPCADGRRNGLAGW